MIYLKRALIALLIIVLSLVLSGFLLVYFYEDAVKNYLLTEINKRLNAVVQVKEIKFSVFDAFPLASLEFKDVSIKDAFPKKEQNQGVLFNAAHVYLSFDLMAVFNKKYTVKKISIRDGALNLKVDADGNDNYHFWKSNSDTAQTNFKFGLEVFTMKDLTLNYSNYFNRQFYHVLCNTSEFSSEFSQASFNLEARCDWFVQHLRVEDVELLEAKPLLFDFKIKVTDRLQYFECEQGALTLANLSFGLKGSLRTAGGYSIPDIYLEAKDMNIGTALSLLPASTLSRLKSYEAKGTGTFRSHIYGRMNKTTAPGLDVSFSIHKGELLPENKLAKLSQIELTGHYSNGRSHAEKTSLLVVDHFSALVNQQMLQARLRLDNFEDPYLKLSAEGKCKLADLAAFVRLDTLENLQGALSFKCIFEGRTKQISKAAFAANKVQASGDLELQDVSFRFKHDSLLYKNLHGAFTLEENNLLVNSFSGAISGNDFQADGIFKNFVSYIFLPYQELSAEGRLTSTMIKLDDFISTRKTNKKDTAMASYFDKIHCKINLDIGALKFKRFSCNNLKGQVLIHDKVLRAQELKLLTMEGQVLLDGTLDASRNDSMLLACNAAISHLNVNQLFYQMEDFGQTVLQAKHLKGFVTAEMDFAAILSKEFNVNLDKIVVKGKLKIENGELLDFKPLLALSRFVKINELKRIQFSTLQNEILIRNQKILIPSMEIKSNALNLSIAGLHDFDNRVDYKLTLLLSDLLGKKVKEHNKEFGEEEDDGLGKTKLYISMKGDMMDPKFAYDKAAVKQKIKADIKAEKETLKKMLKEEFGWFKKDSLKTKKESLNNPSNKGIQIDTDDDKPAPEPQQKRKNAFTRLKEKLKADAEE
jgi:hypothetical protein